MQSDRAARADGLSLSILPAAAEIDKTLKKVGEGVEQFEEQYKKIQASGHSAHKDKRGWNGGASCASLEGRAASVVLILIQSLHLAAGSRGRAKDADQEAAAPARPDKDMAAEQRDQGQEGVDRCPQIDRGGECRGSCRAGVDRRTRFKTAGSS